MRGRGGGEMSVHVLMRDERRKEERSKQGQTNNKAKQHYVCVCVPLTHYQSLQFLPVHWKSFLHMSRFAQKPV